MIALEISSRNARVMALQKRWDRLRAGLDLIPDQRGADMAAVPGGASGLLVRDCRGKGADTSVYLPVAPLRRRLELMARWFPPNRGYRLFPAAFRRAGPSLPPRAC